MKKIEKKINYNNNGKKGNLIDKKTTSTSTTTNKQKNPPPSSQWQDNIAARIQKIKNGVAAIESNHSQTLKATQENQVKQLNEEQSTLLKEVKKDIVVVKEALEEIAR